MEWQESVRRAGRRLPAGDKSFPTLQEGFAVHEDDVTAAKAADFDIRAGPDHFPCVISAGVGLSGPDHIARQDIILHGAPP